MTTVQITLPDQLAQEAQSAGLLTSATIERMLREQLKTRHGDELFAAMDRMVAVDTGDIKALTFDVFGTCVDFRGSLIRDCRAWGKAKGLRVNWARFSDAWRAGYRPAMDRVTRGELPWTKIDALHRMILDDLLVQLNINDLSEDEKFDF